MADPGDAGETQPEATDDTRAGPDPAAPGHDQGPGTSYWLASAELGASTVGEASTPPPWPPPATATVPAAVPPPPAPAPPPATPRPAAAPLPIPGIRPGAPPAEPSPATTSHGRSIVPRIAAVLVMLVIAAAVGYGLAFVSAQLVGGTGPNVPAGVGSAGASLAASITPAGTASVPAAASAAGRSALVPGSPAATGSSTAAASPGASSRIHVVARGETLTSIAARYGVSVRALAAANGITDPNTIYAGQRLVIPGP